MSSYDCDATLPLEGLPEPIVLPEPPPPLSADRRRTQRQREAVAAGVHPLTKQRARPDLGTCGDCRFREVFGYHNRSFPKCTRYESRITHSAASDVRAWWPACPDHELGDKSVGPDAMRVTGSESSDVEVVPLVTG